MENITFGFNTVVGLLGGAFALCVIIFNRAVSDIKDLKEWQILQDTRISKIENHGSLKLQELELCLNFVKKEIDKIKKRKNAKS